MAITEIQHDFLSQCLDDFEIINVNNTVPLSYYRKLKKIISDEDILTIVGGGNTGDLYAGMEYRRGLLMKMFPNNKMILFPQTFTYSDGINSTKNKSIKIFNKKKNLHILTREVNSYQVGMELFPKAKVQLAPDVVLLGENLFKKHRRPEAYDRKGILFCLRGDQEKVENSEVSRQLHRLILENKYEISTSDNVTSYNGEGYEFLKEKLAEQIKTSSEQQLVITDRLHGMIFCYMTDTPCLFLDNSNKKVSGVFEWLRDCSFIRPLDLINLEEDIKELMGMAGECRHRVLKKEFASLFELLNSL